jgi:hypothetical protein
VAALGFSTLQHPSNNYEAIFKNMPHKDHTHNSDTQERQGAGCQHHQLVRNKRTSATKSKLPEKCHAAVAILAAATAQTIMDTVTKQVAAQLVAAMAHQRQTKVKPEPMGYLAHPIVMH